MNNEKWVQRWIVPSMSGGRPYVVAKDKEGNYACSCPGWTQHYPRRDCKHIQEVLAGRAKTLAEATLDRLER